MIYKELRDRLLTNADLASRVGHRVFGKRAPQTAMLPFIIVEQTSKTPVDKLNGTTATYFTTYSVSIFSTSPNDNETLAGLVRTQLNGWIDNDTGKTIRAFLDSESDDIVDIQGLEDGVDRITQDYEISFAE